MSLIRRQGILDNFGISVTAAATLPFANGVHITSQTDGQFDFSQLSGYESWLGAAQSVPAAQPVALCMVQCTRDTYTELTQPPLIQATTNAGRKAIISYGVTLSNSSASQETSWASAAIGTNTTSTGETWNTRHTAFGNWLVSHGQPDAVIRLITEFNNTTGGQPNPYASSAELANFKSAMQVAYTALHAVAGSNFTIAWNPSINPNDPHDLTDAYPGDAYVDVIDLDCYDAHTGTYGGAWAGQPEEWNRRYYGLNNGNNGNNVGISAAGKGIKWYMDFARGTSRSRYAYSTALSGAPKKTGFSEWGPGWYYTQSTTPVDEPYYFEEMFNVFCSTFVESDGSVPQNNVQYASIWEDHDRGIYTTDSGHPMPNSAAQYRSTFGATPTGPWPLNLQRPGTPTIGVASAGPNSLSVIFTASGSGGLASLFTATVVSGGTTYTGTSISSPVVVSGLPAGVAVSASVAASNGAGSSGSSGQSNSVTPTLATSFGQQSAGSSTDVSAAGYRFGNVYTAPHAGTIAKLRVYLSAGSGGGSLLPQMYSASSTATPTNQLGYGTTVTVPANTAAGWFDLPITSGGTVTAGQLVEIGIELPQAATTGSNYLTLYYDNSGNLSNCYEQNSNGDTPDSTWSAGTNGGVAGNTTYAFQAVYA